MKRWLVIILALIMLCLATCAHAAHYGWAFVIYDLQMAIEIDNSYTRTDDEALANTNSFEKSGNVKPDLVLEVYNPETRSQLFVYSAIGSPYDNLDELTRAYAEDLGTVTDAPDANGTTWQILAEQEFNGTPCARIISSFQNVNAEYILMLSEDHSAYIITMITFDGKPPESALDGIAFGRYITQATAEAQETAQPDTHETAQPAAQATAAASAQPTSIIQGLLGALAGKNR